MVSWRIQLKKVKNFRKKKIKLVEKDKTCQLRGIRDWYCEFDSTDKSNMALTEWAE